MKTITRFTAVLLCLCMWSTCFSQQRFWSNIWQSSTVQGKDYLGNWEFRGEETYLNGDFDGDGNDELLIIKAPYAMLQKYGTTINPSVETWHSIWSNGGYGNISPGVAISNLDKYVVGDFDFDGIEELMSITYQPNNQGYVSIFKYNPVSNSWNRTYYSNNGKIGNWTIGLNDKYFAGNFYLSRDVGLIWDFLFCISSDGKAATVGFNGSDISVSEITSTGYIQGIPISKIVATGYFSDGTSSEQLLAVSNNTVAILGSDSPSWRVYWQTPANATNFGDWEFTTSLSDSKVVVAANYERGISGNDLRDEILFIANGLGGPNAGKATLIKNTARLSGNYTPVFNSFWYNDADGTIDGTHPLPANMSGTKYLPIKYKYAVGDTRFRLFESTSTIVYGQYPTPGYVTGKAYMYEFNSYYTITMAQAGLSEPETAGDRLISVDNARLSYKLIPNPSQDFVDIQRNIAENASHYQIYDMLGKKIREGSITEGEYTQKVDLSGFKTGMYTIRLQDGDNITTEKIIVN